MRIRTLAALFAAALCLSTAASARNQFGQRDEIVVDPQMAYIFYRTDRRMDVRFLREVRESELAAWQAERQVAFERARRRYERALASWQRDIEQCRGSAASSAYCRARGPRPDPVTDETFAFPGPELDNFVDVRSGRTFTRGDGAYTYLRAVEPGSYVLYGPVLAAGQMVTGVCLCMGSVRFEARPGQIVDLGELRLAPDEDAGPRTGRFGPNGRLPSPSLVPPTAGTALPDRLAGLPVAPAELHAAERVPNYFGILIDRLAPVPGVLAYERDRIIDLAGEEQAGLGSD